MASQPRPEEVTVRPVIWPELPPTPPAVAEPGVGLDDVPLTLEVVLAETWLTLDTVAGIEPGSVILMGQSVEEPVQLYLQGRKIGEGEVVLMGEQFAVRFTRLDRGDG